LLLVLKRIAEREREALETNESKDDDDDPSLYALSLVSPFTKKKRGARGVGLFTRKAWPMPTI